MIRALGSANRLPFGTCRQQGGAHRRCLSDAVGGNIARDKLHCVVDGHTSGDTSTRAVDVQVDVGFGIIRLQEQHLGDQSV